MFCKFPKTAVGIIGVNFLTPRQATLDLASLSLGVWLNPNLDFVASSLHETLLEECKRRVWRPLITHVSISQNSSRDGSVEPGCTKSSRKSKLRIFGEETPPKLKETNPKPYEVILNDSDAWKVISKERVVLQPRAEHTVLGNVLGRNSRNPSCLLCVERRHVPIEDICVARVLTRPSVEMHKNQSVGKSTLSTSCTQLNMQAPDSSHDLKVSKQLDCTREIRHPPDSITLITAKFSEEELSLPKGKILGVPQEISENSLFSVSDEEDADKVTENTFFQEAIKRYIRCLRSM